MTPEAARADLDAALARMAAGDRRALQAVYRATSARLFGICLRIAGDRESAEDALQETYLKAWRRAATFDAARASAITWLSLIARGAAIDSRRASGRTAAGLDVIGQHGQETGAPPPADRETIDDCLGRLADDQRIPILSAFFDGYSYETLATRGDVPLGTMKSRIRRGLLALRRCLDGE